MVKTKSKDLCIFLTLTYTQVFGYRYFSAAMWRNLTSKSPHEWINCIYSIMTFDLTSNQFLHRLAHHCLGIIFLNPNEISCITVLDYSCLLLMRLGYMMDCVAKCQRGWQISFFSFANHHHVPVISVSSYTIYLHIYIYFCIYCRTCLSLPLPHFSCIYLPLQSPPPFVCSIFPSCLLTEDQSNVLVW